MADPATIYKNYAHCADLLVQKFAGGGYGLDGAYYQHLLSAWAVAGKSDNTGEWQAYYFVQIDSSLRTEVAGTFKINGYILSCHLVDSTGATLPDTQLLSVTPDTTEGSTSYTTSMNESFSASGGFFGEDPTASIGGSVSFGHSVTRSVPDIAVHNQSMAQDGQNASWSLGLAEQAPAQEDTMEFTTQMLFRVPFRPKVPLSLALNFAAAVEDHDNNGTAYFDRTWGIVGPILKAQNIGETVISSRGRWLNFQPLKWALKVPAAPAEAIAA